MNLLRSPVIRDTERLLNNDDDGDDTTHPAEEHRPDFFHITCGFL
jgi:hypothetical protein